MVGHINFCACGLVFVDTLSLTIDTDSGEASACEVSRHLELGISTARKSNVELTGKVELKLLMIS